MQIMCSYQSRLPRRAPGKCCAWWLATSCKHVPRVSASSKSYEHKRKGNIYMYHFCDKIKSQNGFFGCHKASNTWIWILCPLCWLRLDTAKQPIGTIKIVGLFLLPESCLQLTAKILVEWVVFADVTLAICMDLAMSCATCLRHWLVSVLGAICRWWSFSPLLAGFITATVQ
jgi:hypothetical protein